MNNINPIVYGSNYTILAIYPVRWTSWTTTCPSYLTFLKNSISVRFYQRHKCFRILISSADRNEIGFQFVKLLKHKKCSSDLVTAAFVIWAIVAGLAISSYGKSEPDGLSGTVKVDGSSTVVPITEAVAEEFSKINPKMRATVGISGIHVCGCALLQSEETLLPDSTYHIR